MAVTGNVPAAPGTYLLLVALDAQRVLRAGRLGSFVFEAGLYAYAGSAQGPGGLSARVGRHLRAGKAPHWHIDSLTAAGDVVEVWLRASPERLECRWARTLAALPGLSQPVPGFGSSDCACRAHLFRLGDGTLRAAWEALGRPERLTGGGPPTV